MPHHPKLPHTALQHIHKRTPTSSPRVVNRICSFIHMLLGLQGRCNEPVPASFQLQEQLPLGACALLVREDFLDVPLNTDSIWLDSLYVAVSRPPGGDSSVLLLQVRSLPLTQEASGGSGHLQRHLQRL